MTVPLAVVVVVVDLVVGADCRRVILVVSLASTWKVLSCALCIFINTVGNNAVTKAQCSLLIYRLLGNPCLFPGREV